MQIAGVADLSTAVNLRRSRISKRRERKMNWQLIEGGKEVLRGLSRRCRVVADAVLGDGM